MKARRRPAAESIFSLPEASGDLLRELPLKTFRGFQQLMLQTAGIYLADKKVQLVRGRLAQRVANLNLSAYEDYLQLITRSAEERQIAIDLLTTNETFFFRELKHFEFLSDIVSASEGRPLRIWSAACSSGEEPYSIAMLLASRHRGNWEIIGSDISNRVLAKARAAIYPMARTQSLPEGYLQRFCLKGIGSQQGAFIVSPELRSRVHFFNINLNTTLPDNGEFDVIFLRNVMIYFNQQTKEQVVERLTAKLRPGGHLIIGHSESLNGIDTTLKVVRSSVYRKPL